MQIVGCMKRPIHPLVVALPIALFAATIGALLGFVGTHDAVYYRAATIACIAAVLAALPAVRREKLTALPVAMFAACSALLVRNGDATQLGDATLPLAVGVAGMVALVIVALLRAPQPSLALKTFS